VSLFWITAKSRSPAVGSIHPIRQINFYYTGTCDSQGLMSLAKGITTGKFFTFFLCSYSQLRKTQKSANIYSIILW